MFILRYELGQDGNWVRNMIYCREIKRGKHLLTNYHVIVSLKFTKHFIIITDTCCIGQYPAAIFSCRECEYSLILRSHLCSTPTSRLSIPVRKVQLTLVTTTSYVLKDVANKMNLLRKRILKRSRTVCKKGFVRFLFPHSTFVLDNCQNRRTYASWSI